MMLNLVRELQSKYSLFSKKHELIHWMCHCLQMNYTQLCTSTVKVSRDKLMMIEEGCQKLSKGMPLAYLIGTAEWLEKDWSVTQDVLIPRPETQTLFECVLKEQRSNMSVMELGAGSGVISITLQELRPSWHITAVERSSKALDVAKKNAGEAPITWLCEDWNCLGFEKKYDLIFSNPPYLRSDDKHLDDLSYEPLSALVSGPTGLECFHQICQLSHQALKINGKLWFEHGFDQGEEVRELMMRHGFVEVITIKDEWGHNRVTGGIKNV